MIKYLNEDEIRAAFAIYLQVTRDYTEDEAAIAVSDFPNPYILPYQVEEYEDETEINGVEYEVRKDYTNFTPITGEWDDGTTSFCFHTYYRKEDVPNRKVGEYMKARKLYSVDEKTIEMLNELNNKG